MTTYQADEISGPTGLVHEALFYADADEYARGVRRFVRVGLELDEPTLVAVPGGQIELLRDTLGPDASRVCFLDMAIGGRNPGTIIPSVLYPFVRRHQPHRVRVVGEPIWAGRTPAEYRAAVQHEALINVALADQAATILCPYDTRKLGHALLDDARHTHPVLVCGDRPEPSTDYSDPRAVADASLTRLPDPPEWWGDMLVFGSVADLPRVRQFVAELAARAGLPSPRVAELCVAAHELAVNTLTHTAGPGVVSVWQDPYSEDLVCEVSDSGQFTDRLAGRIPPPRFESSGRGLILVNALCDLVELPTGQVGVGTTTRLHMSLRPT